jgi:hypothetical protein
VPFYSWHCVACTSGIDPTWICGESIGIVLSPALTVFGSEFVFLETIANRLVAPRGSSASWARLAWSSQCTGEILVCRGTYERVLKVLWPVVSIGCYGMASFWPSVNNNSASKLCWPSDRLSSAKLMPIFAGRRVLHSQRGRSPTLYSLNLGFLDRSHCFFFQVAPQLYSRSWVVPVPNPLLLRKSGSAGNRTRTSGH